MAGTGIEIEGLENILSKLDNLDDRVNRGINKVLKESAEPLKNGIEMNVNISAKQHHHAIEDVIISRVRSDGGNRDTNYVQVGYASVSWRMFFVEFGTIYQKPQHNVMNAITETKDEVRAIQVKSLSQLINGV